MKKRLDCIILMFVIALITFTQNCLPQNSIENYSDSLYAQIVDYDPSAIIRRENTDKIDWLQIDTFTDQYYNSAIRGHGQLLDTLVISLQLEESWGSSRIEQKKKEMQSL